MQVTVHAVGYCNYWTGQGEAALFAYSETCNNSFSMPGQDFIIIGGIHSNNDMTITGHSNHVTGIASYVTDVAAAPSAVTFDPAADNPLKAPMIAPPLVFELSDYNDYTIAGSPAETAASAGQYVYVNGNITMKWLENNSYYDKSTGVIETGLYYATGDIAISGTGVVANATFVAEGTVDFSGNTQTITAYVDNLVAFAGQSFSNDVVACNSAVIKLSHSGNVYIGVFYAPHGVVNLSGSDITITGGVLSYAISLTGQGVTVINTAIYIPPQPGTVEMTE